MGLLTSGTVEIHLANGFGSWVKATTSLMQGNAKGWRVNVGDFDRNGHLDIVAGFGTEEETGSIKVWREATIPQQLGVTLTSPDGKEYFKAGAVRFIRWLSAVPAGTGTRTVKLELSTSGSGGPWSLIGEDLPDTGIYQWTVPNVESSDAYIRITLSDNIGNSASDTSDNAFETKIVGAVNQPPTLDILQPDGEGDTADESFTIEWSADDPDGDALTIDLYYDNDTDPDNGMTLIAADLADTGSYDWNTSAVEEGDYYVYGVADDGNGSRAAAYSPGTVRIEHGGGPVNNPPSITITRPAEAGEAAEEAYTVEWEAEDPDGDEVTVDLYYDEDTDPDNGRTLIASDLADTGSYDWDTGEVAEGEYYIYGVAGDPHGATAADYSAGTVTVPHNPENRAPQIALTTPAEAGELTNENYLIEWQTSDPDDDELTLALYFDADTDPDNGLTLIIEGLADTGSYQWDTSPVAAGDYYLYAVADDGQATAAAYSDYTLGISHPPPNRPPAVTWLAPEPGATVQGAVALVITTSPDAVAVALAYRAPGGAWLPLPPARSDGEAWRAEWRTGGLAPGPYELRAAATDAAGWEGEATLALTVATPAPVGEAGGSNGWLWMMFAALAVVAGVALGGYLLWWRPRAEKEWTAAPLGESGPLPPLAEQAPEALARPLFPSDSGGEAQPEWEVEWR